MKPVVHIDPVHAELRKVDQTCTYLRRGLWAAEFVFVAAVLHAMIASWAGSSSVIGTAFLAGIVGRVLLTAFTKRRRALHEVIEARYGYRPDLRAGYGISIVLPWRAAKALFKPVQGKTRRARALERLAFWRSVAGLLTVAAVTATYASIQDIARDAVQKMATNALIAMLAAPGVLLVLFFITQPDFLLRFRSGVAQLLWRLLFGVISIAVPFGIVAGSGIFLESRTEDRGSDQVTGGVETTVAIVLVLLLLWLSVYAACTAYWAARTSFWISDVHPLLAPTGSILIAVAAFGAELVGRVTSDADQVPNPLWLVLNACGLVTTLALAIAEYRHLRGGGIGWSTGPDPVEPITERILLPGLITDRSPEHPPSDSTPTQPDIPRQRRPDGQENP